MQGYYDNHYSLNQGLVGSFQDVAGSFPAAREAADNALAPSAAVPGKYIWSLPVLGFTSYVKVHPPTLKRLQYSAFG